MLSVFKKLGFSSKPNPYMNPHHLGHTPFCKITRPTTASTTTDSISDTQASHPAQSAPQISLRSSSSSSSLLAEARRSAGRDPVSGKRQPSPDQRKTQSRVSLADELRQVEAEERTMYQNRSLSATRTMGSKYELFAQEMIRRRDEEMRVRALRGGLEYYAPERRLEEYYSAPLAD